MFRPLILIFALALPVLAQNPEEIAAKILAPLLDPAKVAITSL